VLASFRASGLAVSLVFMAQQQVLAKRLAMAILRLLPAVNGVIGAHRADGCEHCAGLVLVAVRPSGWPLPRWI
jgi:hypothetical protein